MSVQPRKLSFTDFSQVHSELDRLHRGGYDRLGQWDLAQICDHLAYFIRESLDGFTFRVPWLIKFLFGRLVLRQILKTGRMRSGVTTPQKPLPAPGGDEAAAITRLKEVIDRLCAHPGELHTSPFFGYLTPEQWRKLHLIHCAHHLGYLVPKSVK
jgi:hypothetical protein